KMDMLAMLLADWNAVVDVLTKKAELIGSDEERAAAWRRVGECKRDMLEDTPGAIEAFERALELDPTRAWTIDSLTELHEARDDAGRLVELYQRRVELCEDDEEELKYELLVKAARRYQAQIKDNPAAIDMLRQALDVRPADQDVLSKLEALFRIEEMWPDLLETLRLEASVAESTEDRIKLRREIGKLHANELAEPSEALEAFRMVVDEAPEDGPSIDAVRSIGEDFEDLRLEAAEILEPVLRSTGQHEKLVDVLEMRLRAQQDPQDRAQTLRAMADVLDSSLSDQAKAVDALIRAMEETPEDTALHEDIERLAETSDGFAKYADALGDRAGKIFEATLATDLWTRLGHICEGKLSDDKRAVAAFTHALEQAGDSPELLEALDRLHSKLGNAQELSEILERRVSVESDPLAQADLFHRLAELQIEDFGDKTRGLETLRMALDHAPDHEKASATLEKLTEDRALFEEAASALETVYRTRADYEKLADLYEKRVSFAEAPLDRLQMRLDLARVLEEQAADTKRAQRVIEAALGDDVADNEVLGKLQELADVNQQWTEAAKAFSDALEKADDLDPMTARDLFTRLAGWHRDKLGDSGAAEAAMSEALERDPDNLDLLRSIEDLQREPGREKELIATLRRRAVLELDVDKRRELFREAKSLAETALDDPKLSEEVLRQLIELDDGYLWAYEELTQLREKAEDYKEVVELLLKRAELTAYGPDTLQLRHQAAEVLRDKLDDSDRALEIYEEIFDADPMDAKAAEALRQLYAKQERHQELGDLLGRLIDVATEPEERNKLRLELAELYAGRFDQMDEAILVLHRVLDEEPGQTDAVVILSQLYEKGGRDRDLADLLNTQIELAKERGDAEAELTFMVRLGEVYEARLGDTAKAIETYEQVLERDSSHRGALESLGRLFEAKDEKRKAAETLEKLLGLLDGDEAVALSLRLAGIFELIEDDEGARRALERGLSVRRDSAEVREALRRLYERTGAWAEVADLLAEDADNAEDDAQKVKLLQQAADIHMSKRDDAGAAAVLLDKASELAPDDRDLLLSLCDAYSASGRGKDAIAALEKIVESYGGKRVKELAAIHHRLAKAYVSEGDKEKGLSELDQAFRITPGDLGILVDLGRLALDLGDLERAQKTFRALLLQRLDAKAPITKAEVFYYLGNISHQQGEKQKAIQMLERALENDANLDKAKELLAEVKG
ncbi:MAG: tetratricopeptide repeat protein, partial [Myxococcota bacterium]